MCSTPEACCAVRTIELQERHNEALCQIAQALQLHTDLLQRLVAPLDTRSSSPPPPPPPPAPPAPMASQRRLVNQFETPCKAKAKETDLKDQLLASIQRKAAVMKQRVDTYQAFQHISRHKN